MVAGYIVSSRNDSAVAIQLRRRLSSFASGRGDYISLWMIDGTDHTDSLTSFKALMDRMSRGDAVYVDDITTLGVSFKEILFVLSEAIRRGIRVYGASDGYTNHSVRDRESYLQALEHMSNAYRLLVSSKTKAALSRKKSAGEKLGRPDGSCVKMRILIKNKQHIRSALENGESISSLCSRYNVSRSTFRRFMKNTEIRQVH